MKVQLLSRTPVGGGESKDGSSGYMKSVFLFCIFVAGCATDRGATDFEARSSVIELKDKISDLSNRIDKLDKKPILESIARELSQASIELKNAKNELYEQQSELKQIRREQKTLQDDLQKKK